MRDTSNMEYCIEIDQFKFEVGNIKKAWDACWYVDDYDVIASYQKAKEYGEIVWYELDGVDRHDVESFYSDIIKTRIEKELWSKKG